MSDREGAALNLPCRICPELTSEQRDIVLNTTACDMRYGWEGCITVPEHGINARWRAAFEWVWEQYGVDGRVVGVLRDCIVVVAGDRIYTCLPQCVRIKQ